MIGNGRGGFAGGFIGSYNRQMNLRAGISGRAEADLSASPTARTAGRLKWVILVLELWAAGL